MVQVLCSVSWSSVKHNCKSRWGEAQENKVYYTHSPREGVTACHPGSREKHQVLVRSQEPGARAVLRPQPWLVFMQERQSRAGEQLRTGWGFQWALSYRSGLQLSSTCPRLIKVEEYWLPGCLSQTEEAWLWIGSLCIRRMFQLSPKLALRTGQPYEGQSLASQKDFLLYVKRW